MRLTLHRLQVAKSKALYVGDSLDDILAAKSAGVRVVIIVTKDDSKIELLSARPHQLIYRFNEPVPVLTGGKTMTSGT